MAQIDAASDAALVAGIVGRDAAAFEEIYRRYSPAVWGLARRVCSDTHEAEEVTQRVFTDLWFRPERFDAARGRLRTWLLVQAHSRAVEAKRSAAARRRREDGEARRGVTPPSADVEATVHLAALAGEVRQALDSLPRTERDPILLAYFGGHSYRAAAALLGEPEGTVKSRIRAGMERLRGVLETRGMAQ